MFKLDNKGQLQLISVAVSAIVGVVCVIIMTQIYGPSLANENSYVSAGAKNMLGMTDFILAAGVLIMILAGLVVYTKMR